MDHSAEHYRSRAERAKEAAKRVPDPNLKRQWLVLAQGFAKLAQMAAREECGPILIVGDLVKPDKPRDTPNR